MSMNKIKNVQNTALRFILNEYESDYKTLLKKCNKCTMEVKRLFTLALETFKTLNDLNLTFTKYIFLKKSIKEKKIT